MDVVCEQSCPTRNFIQAVVFINNWKKKRNDNVHCIFNKIPRASKPRLFSWKDRSSDLPVQLFYNPCEAMSIWNMSESQLETSKEWKAQWIWRLQEIPKKQRIFLITAVFQFPFKSLTCSVDIPLVTDLFRAISCESGQIWKMNISRWWDEIRETESNKNRV